MQNFRRRMKNYPLSFNMQGSRTESELSELVSKIGLDIKTDGKLDNTALQSALINKAALLNGTAVRENVVNRYSALGLNVAVGEFEKYVQNFVSQTSFPFTKKIEYPASGKYGANLLAQTAQRLVIPNGSSYNWRTNPVRSQAFSLAALAPAGTKLRVRLTAANTFNTSATLKTTDSWKTSTDGKEFEITQADALTDGELYVTLYGQDSLPVRLELFENGAVQPTGVKNFVFVGEAVTGEPITYEKISDGVYTFNVLAAGVTTLSARKRNALFADVPPGQQVRVKITSGAKLDVNPEDPYWNYGNSWKKLSYAYNNGQEVQELVTISNLTACSLKPADGAVLPFTLKIEIFENGATQPTRVQQLTWEEGEDY